MSSEPTPTPSLSSEVMDSNPADDEAVREAEMIQGKRARFMQGTDILPGSTEDKKIFTAYDRDQGVEVAMHVVSSSGPDRPRSNLYDFQHEHLMKVIDSWHEEDKIIYITEILTAGTLEGYIKRIKEDVRLKVVRKWCSQILSALEYLHDTQNEAHGDLRLDNIFINGESGNIRLGTFRMVARSTSSGNPTEAGRFTPPEDEYNPRKEGDVYCFALCVLQMVTRVKPYWMKENETYYAMQEAKKRGELPIPLKELEEKSESRPEIVEFIKKCLAADPSERPSVRQLREHPWLTEKRRKKENPKKKESKEKELESGASPSASSATAEAEDSGFQVATTEARKAVSQSGGSEKPTENQFIATTGAGVGNATQSAFVRQGQDVNPKKETETNNLSEQSAVHVEPVEKREIPRLVGVTFERFQFRRAKVTIQMSIFYPSSTSKETLAYRSLLFNVALDDPNETPRKIAHELVDHALVHPEDLEPVESWLSQGVGKLWDASYTYTREVLPESFHISEYKCLYNTLQTGVQAKPKKPAKSQPKHRGISRAQTAQVTRPHSANNQPPSRAVSESHKTSTNVSRLASENRGGDVESSESPRNLLGQSQVPETGTTRDVANQQG